MIFDFDVNLYVKKFFFLRSLMSLKYLVWDIYIVVCLDGIIVLWYVNLNVLWNNNFVVR